MNANDSWQTDSTAFSDYDGTVVTAWFQTSEFVGDNGKARVELNLTLETDDPTHPVWTERYSLGSTKSGGDWIIMDEGDSVAATDGATRIVGNSNYGKFINAAVDLAGSELQDRGTPLIAATWIGTRWHMNEVEGQFKGKDGKMVKYSRNYPEKFLGL